MARRVPSFSTSTSARCALETRRSRQRRRPRLDAARPRPRVTTRGLGQMPRTDRLAPFTIVVDTREQTPYPFEDLAPSVRAKLEAGDYSIVGYEGAFAVERKSLADAYATFSRDRARFERELERLRAYELKA